MPIYSVKTDENTLFDFKCAGVDELLSILMRKGLRRCTIKLAEQASLIDAMPSKLAGQASLVPTDRPGRLG